MEEEPDRECGLRRERPGHDLSEREREVVRLFVEDSPALDEVSAHVSDERGRAAEADRA